jgi:hypothetical protein
MFNIKSFITILIFAGMTIGPAAALEGHIYVIGGSPRTEANPGDDQPMLDALTGMGLTYSYHRSSDVIGAPDPAALVAGHDLIYISESIGSPDGPGLNAALGDLDFPLIHAEVGINPAMGMAAQPGASFLVTDVTIPDDAGPAANGLSGTVTVYTVLDEIIHSDPEPEATVVARVRSETSPFPLIACVFYYDTGDQMINRVAPNKRGFWLANRRGFTRLNANGLKLLEGLFAFCLPRPPAAARWPLSDGAGTSPSETIGGLIGAMRNMDAGEAWLGDEPSPTTGALCFDGIDDFVTIPNGPGNDIGAESFAVSFLVRQQGVHNPGNPSEENRWIGKGTFGEGTGGRYECYQTGYAMHWALDDGTTESRVIADASPVVDGEWKHVVCVRDREADPAAELRVYVNGKLVGSAEDATGDLGNAAEPLILGASTAADRPEPVGFFEGCLSDVRIYKRVLTDLDIAILFSEYAIVQSNGVTGWGVH